MDVTKCRDTRTGSHHHPVLRHSLMENLKMKINAFFAALLMLAATCVLAAAPAGIAVEGVQMPAWVEQANGARVPLAIGMALSNKDRVFTGPGSRVLLRLADGSLIKLGENGLLALDDLGQKRVNMKNVV